MLSYESDDMSALWPNDKLTFTFLNKIPKWTFDLMLSWESDKMTAVWPNQIFTFTFYDKFSHSIPNWTTFVKELFWYDT